MNASSVKVEQTDAETKKVDVDELFRAFKSEIEAGKAPVDVKVEMKKEQTEAEVKPSTSEEQAPVEKDPLLDEFYSEIDDIKLDTFKSTSKEQIDRLLRPGSTYFNLNPFDVLQIDPYAALDDIKRRYKKMSIYVHPDKNPNDKERAQVAFEAVNRAYKMLEDDKERKKCLEVVDEAREQVDKMCEDKRKKLRRQASEARALDKHAVVETKIDEDDPDKYRHSIYVMTCKLFADLERLRVKDSEKKAEEKKRKHEEKSEEEVKNKIQKEWDRNYEESRQGRVNSWQSFVKKGPGSGSSSSSSTAKSTGFRPPKQKPESR